MRQEVDVNFKKLTPNVRVEDVGTTLTFYTDVRVLVRADRQHPGGVSKHVGSRALAGQHLPGVAALFTHVFGAG